MEENRKTTVGLTESQDFVCLEDLKKTQNFSGVSPISLDYLGSEHCHPGYCFGPYVRENYVLHLVRDGEGVLKKGDRTWKIHAGEAFLIYPGETTEYRADMADPWNYLWIGFHGFQTEEILLHAGFSRENPVVAVRATEDLDEVLKKLLSNLELSFSAEMMRTANLYELMSLLARNYESGADHAEERKMTPDHQYVQRAVEVITASYRSRLRVEDIAKQIGISRNYLSGIFKKKMGVSPQEFLIDFRMDVAASLLRNTENPVNAVAMEVGYSDPLSFSKAFRRKYRMSPTEYREEKPELAACSAKGEYTSDNPL